MKGSNKERTMGYMHGHQTKGTTCCPAARKGMRRRLNKVVRQHEQRLLLAETRAMLDAERERQKELERKRQQEYDDFWTQYDDMY
jgi:hypothetical protein